MFAPQAVPLIVTASPGPAAEEPTWRTGDAGETGGVATQVGVRQYSGIGGHEDFVAVSGFQLSDRSLICLPSASEVEGVQLPRIVDRFPPGTSVTTPRHHIDVVVTEYGVAELAGRTVRERALALAGIAHPKFRDELLDAARRDFAFSDSGRGFPPLRPGARDSRRRHA